MAAKDDPAFLENLRLWSEAVAEAARWKDAEMALRLTLFGDAFPDPVEGTNKCDLPLGWLFKASHKISRTIDPAALPAAREELTKLNVNPDTLVKYKPELVVSAYKALSEQARLTFDNCLVIKPGAPSLELVPPKQPKVQEAPPEGVV